MSGNNTAESMGRGKIEFIDPLRHSGVGGRAAGQPNVDTRPPRHPPPMPCPLCVAAPPRRAASPCVARR